MSEAFASLTPAEDLFAFASDLAVVCESLQEKSTSLSTTQPSGLLSSKEKEQQQARADRQANMYRAMIDLQAFSDAAFNGAAAVEAGDITEEEAQKLLPQQFVPEGTAQRLSKRRQAMAAQAAREARLHAARNEFIEPWAGGLFLGELLSGEILEPDRGLSTDPRRIASGRDKSRLTATKPLTADEAETEFFQATADTHGGKSRHPGKNGRHYVGKNGRRIRKK